MTYVVGHFLGGPKKDAIDFVPALAFDAAFSLEEVNGSLLFCEGSTFLPLEQSSIGAVDEYPSVRGFLINGNG